jgi:high-affinity nickel-transport protein
MGVGATQQGLSRRYRLRHALAPEEWRRAGLLFLAVALLHAVGLVLLLAVVVPSHLPLGPGGGVFGVGLGLTAYTLGMRHAFDVDHIAAIDNTTRKLMADGPRPLSVGFFFSLGHSTVVFVLAALLALGVRGLGDDVADGGSSLHAATGLIGPSVSGAFLLLIGVVNLVVLCGVVRVFRRMRHGELDEAALEQELGRRGVMNRVLGRATRAVHRPWHMYPLGILFGLGFDTATEIALLATAGAAATGGVPFYAILCLPILFAAGMSLLDTLDGVCMSVAYDWAFCRPVRKVFYNIAITALSVAVALAVGAVQALQVLSAHLHADGAFWDALQALDFTVLGYAVVILFILTWAAAAAVWRFAQIEQRWSADLAPGEPA